MSDIDERSTSGLRKDGRRFARRAEIDGAVIESVQKLRSGGILDPLDVVAERATACVRVAPALEEDESAIFLNLRAPRASPLAPEDPGVCETEDGGRQSGFDETAP